MDANNDDVYDQVATGVTATSYTKTGLAAGSTYRFRVRARNVVEYSVYSSVFSIVAATIPKDQGAPTTSVIDEYKISISWDLPIDQGGLDITGYKVEIQTATSTFKQDLTDCDAENDSTIISTRTCIVRVDETLRQSPFDLQNHALVFARVTSINDIGVSAVSSGGTGAAMPIADVVPDPPTTFVRDELSTTKTQVAFSWSAPVIDGGDTVIDYAIEMDDDNDDVYTEIATGVTSTSYTQTGLQAGDPYRFRVRARNGIGYSSYSSVFLIVAATIPKS